jgi:tRNA A-37 threonylcarbamoyl transferase component Bud32
MKVISILVWSREDEELLCVVESKRTPNLVTKTHGSRPAAAAWCVSMGARSVSVFALRPGVTIVLGHLGKNVDLAHVPTCCPKDALVAADADLECYLWFLVFGHWSSDTAVLVTTGRWYNAITSLLDILPFERSQVTYSATGRIILRTKDVAWKVRLLADSVEAEQWDMEHVMAQKAARAGVGPRVRMTRTLDGVLGVMGMDWLSRTVKDVLSSSPAPDEIDQLRLSCQGLAERLASQGILHLDFKAANLVFAANDQLLAIDFGEGWSTVQRSIPVSVMAQAMLFVLSVHAHSFGAHRIPLVVPLGADDVQAIHDVFEQTDSWDLLYAYKPDELECDKSKIVGVLAALVLLKGESCV